MTVTEEERLSLSTPEPFQDPAVAHDIFTRLRAEEPVAWCPEPWGGPGFWSITRYDDIQAISKLPQVFSSDGRRGGITLPDEKMLSNRARALGRSTEPAQELSAFEGGRSMITMDPPEHNQHRGMVAPGFRPQVLAALVPRIRERAAVILDALGAQGECEFVSSVAAELPIQMLAELFAAPQEDRHKLFQWSNLVIGGEDPDLQLPREQIVGAFMEMAAYAMQLHQARSEQPGDDLISMLVRTRVDGQPMSVADYLSAFVLLVVAGNETTRNSISGGVLALSQYPEQRQRLLDDPTLILRAVEEIIRWVHPVVYMRRTALEDFTVRGVTIRAGDKVALWYASGNRDEEKWPDPFTFDVGREGPRHLSFGFGQHLCIGWRLAELQLTVVLEELLARYPNLDVTGPVARIRTNFLNSIKSMPVRYRRAAAA